MLPRGVQRQLPSCQIHHGLRPRWTVPLCSEPFTALTPPLPPTATKAGSALQHSGDGTLLPASPGVPRQIPATGGASGCSTLRSPRSLSITPGLPQPRALLDSPHHPTILRVAPRPRETCSSKRRQNIAAGKGTRPCSVVWASNPRPQARGTGHVPPTSRLSQSTPSQPRAPSRPSRVPADAAESFHGHGGEEPGGPRTPSPPGWAGSPPGPCCLLHRGLWRCRACPCRAWGGAGGASPQHRSAPGSSVGSRVLTPCSCRPSY